MGVILQAGSALSTSLNKKSTLLSLVAKCFPRTPQAPCFFRGLNPIGWYQKGLVYSFVIHQANESEIGLENGFWGKV